VLEEDMLEVECTNLTPEARLRASGHVDRFSDYLVKEITADKKRVGASGRIS
jgi:glycyl-tRNA synthetase